jgi:hypothetical protein
MAGYNSTNIKLEIDVSSGGALQDITSIVKAMGPIKVTAGTVETTPFGVAFPQFTATGMKPYGDFTLEFPYDDAATTGSDAVFKGVGETRSFACTYGSTKKTSGEVIIVDYERPPVVGTIHMSKVTLRWTGTVAEA